MKNSKANLEYTILPWGHIANVPSVEKIQDGSTPKCSHVCCGQKATHFAEVTLGRVKMASHLVFCPEHARMIEAIFRLDWILDEDEPPEAEVVADGRCWRILECPYCGQEHSHGRFEPEAKSLGHRVAHCRAPFKAFSDKGYYLVKEDYPANEPEFSHNS